MKQPDSLTQQGLHYCCNRLFPSCVSTCVLNPDSITSPKQNIRSEPWCATHVASQPQSKIGNTLFAQARICPKCSEDVQRRESTLKLTMWNDSVSSLIIFLKLLRSKILPSAFIYSLIPHMPCGFDLSGQVRNDPAFYCGERTEPIDEWHQRYRQSCEIDLINRRMVENVERLLAESETPPMIVIPGDHGFWDDNRFQIL